MADTSAKKPQRTKTWILVANRERARFFETDGPMAEAVPTRALQNPQGRLQDHEINTDRGGVKGGIGGQGGMENKNEAQAHDREQFAQELARLVDKAFAEHEFDRLVLVAAPRFLGDLRKSLAASTTKAVVAEFDKDLIPVNEPEMTQAVRALSIV